GELVACGYCNAAVAVPLSPTAAGALLGDFLIVKEIGSGGMGKVYLAHQISLDRDVALKVLSANFARDAVFIQNFINEARMAAALNHPNIVQAYAVNADAEHYYFAMELIEGNTMKQVLQNSGRLVHEKVLSIATDIIAALAYAWQEKKLIHRDIKPDNIMLTYDGRTKLADMGLARKITGTGEDGSAELYGTPQYVAPELILGAAGDLRSDIYSLGATLYHALSGGYPFQTTDLNEMALKHLCEPLLPLRERVPDVPAPLARLVEVMMAKRPQHRYQNYEQLQADLARVGKGQMPLLVLPDGAQQPVDMESDDPMGLGGQEPAAPVPPGQAGPAEPEAQGRTASGGIKLGQKGGKISLGGKGGSSSTGKAPLVLEAKGEAEKTALPEEEPESGSADSLASLEHPPAGPGAKKVVLLIGVLAVLLLVAGGVAAWFFLGRDDGAAAAPDNAAGESPAAAADSRLAGLQAKIQAAAPEPEIMAELLRLAYEVEAGTPDYDALLKLAGPYLEPVLQSARAVQMSEIQSGWSRRIEAFKEQKQREEEEAKVVAEQARKEAEAAREQKQREEEARKLAEEFELAKQQIRDKVVQCATQLDFSGARVPFAVMSQSSNEEEKDWAMLWLSYIDQAEALFLSLKNSKDKVAGVSFRIRNEKNISQEWKVSTISYNTVRLKLVKSGHERRGKGQEEEEQEKSYELDQMAEGGNNFVLLVQEALKADGRESEFDNLYGSFLLVRGEQIAHKHLEAAMASERILSELPLLRSSYVKTQVERLKIRPKARALQYARYLKKNYPDEFAPYEEEAKTIIEGLAN
ncbi:MAG: protein kinase, partial [Oligosphaeraceae bacterium]|nr:protein kinase [Oligosphaeraceae bacterium]